MEAQMPLITQLSQLDPDKSYTYADYLTWRFEEFVELIKGKALRKMVGPSARHQRTSRQLGYAIEGFVRKGPCEMFQAPFDVRLTRSTGNGDAQIKTVVQPDIFVVCDRTKIDERGCLGAPDWIVEILSPGNLSHDTRTKFDLYEENGVREYWILDPGLKAVVAYALAATGRYELVAEYAAPGPMPVAAVPGLVLQWADVFDDL